MRVVSPMARLVVMLGLVALVAWVEPLARLARTRHRWLAVLAGRVATRARLAPALRASAVRMDHPSHAMAASVALAVPAEREPIAALVALVAVAVLGRAPVVVWVLRASVARAAVAARAGPAGMQAASPMAQLVVMPALVALVEWVALLARLARTLRRCLAVLAVSAVTLARQERALKA